MNDPKKAYLHTHQQPQELLRPRPLFCLNIDCTLLVFQDNPVSIVIKPDCFTEELTLCTVCQRWALDKLPRDKAARNVFAHAGLVGVISCSGSVFLAWELFQLWHFQLGFCTFVVKKYYVVLMTCILGETIEKVKLMNLLAPLSGAHMGRE